jgi:hypothetical protein
MVRIKEGELVFVVIMLILPMLARLLWLSGNREMWQACNEALSHAEKTMPGE